jgi:hypothetical protein
MKKVLLTLTVAAGLAMTSCGGTDMCSCFETQMEMSKELEAAGDDEAKQKEVEDKYKADKDACKKLGETMKEEMKDMSNEDAEKKFKEMQDDCPAMKEAMGGH